MYTIGLVGFGFINKALAFGFSHHTDIKIYDKYNDVYDNLYDVVNGPAFVFVGVPTPMSDDGEQDLSSLDDAIASIVRVAVGRKIIVLRSTVVPGTTRKYAEKYTEHSFVFIPEFLTERRANLEFINAPRIILGGEEKDVTPVYNFYANIFRHTPIYRTTWEGAEISKYMANCFSAVKISFMNEFYDVAKRFDLEYDDMRDMLLAGGWVNPMHTDVPGHDGQRGYGGKCFHKDMAAFIKWADDNELTSDMLKAAQKVNKNVRDYKDWEDIVGATSKNNYKLED